MVSHASSIILPVNSFQAANNRAKARHSKHKRRWDAAGRPGSNAAESAAILENVRRRFALSPDSRQEKLDRLITKRLLRSIHKANLAIRGIKCEVTSSMIWICGVVDSHVDLQKLALIGRQYSAGRKLNLQVEVRPHFCNLLLSPHREDHQNNSHLLVSP